MSASSQTITIENLANPMPISAPAGVGTYTTTAPSLRGSYVYSVLDAPGLVATNNFVTLFNPAASGHNIVVLGIFVSCYVAAGGSVTRNSLHGHLASSISGGTLAPANTIAKFQSGFPNPIAEVRTGNPTATTAAEFFQSPPPLGATTSQYVHSIGNGASTAGGGLILLPTEGIAIQTNVGNINQTWNISLVWGEF